MDDQEFVYNGEYVTIWGEVKDKPDWVIVMAGGDYGTLEAVLRSNLTPKEESYQYKRAKEREKELNDITRKAEANLNRVADKLVDRALRSLASRMKFNLVFGKAGEGNSWVMPIVEELEKMIKEKAKDEMKEFEL